MPRALPFTVQPPADDQAAEHTAVRAKLEPLRRQKELERLIAHRARVMRRISHDLRGPLGVADGLAQMLERGVLGDLPPRQAESVRRIRRSLDTAIRSIFDLLAVARLPIDNLAVAVDPTDVEACVRQAIEASRPAAAAARVHFEDDIATTPRLYSDARQIEHVVASLLATAAQRTPPGEVVVIRLSASDLAAPAPGRWLRLTIEHAGAVTPAEMSEMLLEEHARAGTGAVPASGTALGGARRIAWALGGDLVVDTRPRAVSYTLWLPVDGN